MAQVPTNFRKTPPVIANYDFFDIASGTGYVEFYGGKTASGYKLSNTAWYSEGVGTFTDNLTSVADTLELDIDFDVVLNRPFLINGRVIIIAPFSLKNGTASSNAHGYVKVYLKRVVNGVEATLGNATGTTLINNDTGGSAWRHFVSATEFNITNEIIGVGETMRLTVEFYAWEGSGGETMYGILQHDPKNRTTDDVLKYLSNSIATASTDTTQLIMQLPLRINL